MISFDIVICTYNRPQGLACVLDSIGRAKRPPDMSLRVIVVDNNSSESHRQGNRDAVARSSDFTVVYEFEVRQGLSWARNSGIAAASADYVGFLDDDEQVDETWLEVAATYLRAGQVDYLGGPYKPDWSTTPPSWLPAGIGKYPATIGWIEQSALCQPFEEFGGSLCGGNCMIRRSLLQKLGGFSTLVGRSPTDLMGGEDDDMHRRLQLVGAQGMYDPAWVIYHRIPASRLTRRYHLRWAFWSGTSNGVRLRTMPKIHGPHWFGIPRYRYAKGLLGVGAWMAGIALSSSTRSARGMVGLMDCCYLLGMVYGLHVFRRPSLPVAAG